MSQRPRCKHTGHQTSSDASIGVLEPRGSRQMDMPACPLGSLPAGIKRLFCKIQAIIKLWDFMEGSLFS